VGPPAARPPAPRPPPALARMDVGARRGDRLTRVRFRHVVCPGSDAGVPNCRPTDGWGTSGGQAARRSASSFSRGWRPSIAAQRPAPRSRRPGTGGVSAPVESGGAEDDDVVARAQPSDSPSVLVCRSAPASRSALAASEDIHPPGAAPPEERKATAIHVADRPRDALVCRSWAATAGEVDQTQPSVFRPWLGRHPKALSRRRRPARSGCVS